MFQDALWTTLYTDDEIRMIEEIEQQDQETQNSIQELLELCTQ